MIPHIFNGNGTISLMIDGVMKPVDTAHKYYNKIKEAVKAENWDIIPDLVNIKKQVETAINDGTAKGKVIIQDGEVYYNQKRIHNTLTERIVNMAREGFDIGHMVKFLENLMENPSYRAVNELYGFLEAGSIPITENGTFLTYKKIAPDWTDIYSGKFDNSIGSIVKMPRNEVDEDSSITCSRGLHVCAFNYLSNYGTCSDNRVIICEVNPANVCAVPQDYNNTKMRVCEYKVIGEVKNYTDTDSLASNAVMFTNTVKSGKVEGTVNHLKPKDIGKALTEALNKWINDDTFGLQEMSNIIIDICIDADLKSDFAYDIGDIIFEDQDFKRAGKKVARLIKNELMKGDVFMSNLENVDENPSEMVNQTSDKTDPAIDPFGKNEKDCDENCFCDPKNGTCSGCFCCGNTPTGFNAGNENMNNDPFKARRCDRCGNPLKGGTDMCDLCGYYND